VPTRGTTTLYSRIGDIFAYLCLAGLVAVVILAIVRRKGSA
jgi:apolipoprotein N-acyltransferase